MLCHCVCVVWACAAHCPSNLRIWLSPEGQMSGQSQGYFSTSGELLEVVTEHTAMVGGGTLL